MPGRGATPCGTLHCWKDKDRMPRNVVVLLNNDEGRRLVVAKCKRIGVKIAVFEDLVDAELDKQGMMRRAGLWDKFDEILDGAADDEAGR